MSVSGNDGNAAARLGVSSRLDYILSSRLDFVHNGCLGASGGLDLIQARDDPPAEDIGVFRPHLGDEVAEFASVGHVALNFVTQTSTIVPSDLGATSVLAALARLASLVSARCIWT